MGKVGAGQTGLQIAARLKQMNVRVIVVERNARVGDNWRQRYPTLSLNTPRTHHTRKWFVYLPLFPWSHADGVTSPVFTLPVNLAKVCTTRQSSFLARTLRGGSRSRRLDINRDSTYPGLR